jgi:hypothetical protein
VPRMNGIKSRMKTFWNTSGGGDQNKRMHCLCFLYERHDECSSRCLQERIDWAVMEGSGLMDNNGDCGCACHVQVDALIL